MGNILDEIKTFDGKMDELTQDCLELQITCMLLHHAGCMKIKEDDIENGLIIITFVEELRKALAKQKEEFVKAFDDEEVTRAYTRTGGDRILFSSLSNAVIKSNSLYFDIPSRPQGAEYVCDEALCQKRIQAEVQKYFSSLWKAA